MCGIAGILGSPTYGDICPANLVEAAQAMAATIHNRGPDDKGVWSDGESGVALAHRRLAVIDLSPTGHQPMHSADGRFVLVYNGEVYNFSALRKELETCRFYFSGNSDTEVVLAALAHWGVKQALAKFVGMFALALWDRKKKVLYLARDHVGIKPLYYGSTDKGCFLFASELKALRACPGFSQPVNRQALGLFFRHNYIPAPLTIYQDIYKLEPGCFLSLSLDGQAGSSEPVIEAYWSARDIWLAGMDNPWQGNSKEAVNSLEEVLMEAVQSQMMADVPLGAFLSGGIDSSTVVALMQTTGKRKVRTFSIGFAESTYDEAPMARAVAQHLDTDHTELYVSSADALSVIPDLPAIWDEPFADSSQIPTYLVSKLAGQHVTVSLSGDGGDELFSGYSRYRETLRLWKIRERLSGAARKAALGILHLLPDQLLDAIGCLTRPFLIKCGIHSPLGQVSRRLIELIRPDNFHSFYGWVSSHQLPYGEIVSGHDEISSKFFEKISSSLDHRAVMSLLDINTYLPDDILTKVDRASMAVSLETRVPLLDHRVVEFAARLPPGMKVRNEVDKWILREVLYKYVPKELVDRPKKGFGVPVGQWLRGPLREWCEDMLAPERIQRDGYLNHNVVSLFLQDHLSGKCNHRYTLWNILMFQAWLEAWE